MSRRLEDFAAFAMRIAAEASAIPRGRFRSALAVDHKADDSPVTAADRETEHFLRAAIRAEFPDHGIFGEEFGSDHGSGRYRWMIDPIDGTKSFVTGMPLYGILIALLCDGAPVLGLIHMPELDETFLGAAGRSVLNRDIVLACAPTTALDEARIYINEADSIRAGAPEAFAALCRAGRIRRFGYDCYPHALVAAGHADACIDYGLKPYDYCALVPVIEGAGGVMTDWQGKPLTLDSDGRVVAAATRELHASLLELLAAG